MLCKTSSTNFEKKEKRKKKICADTKNKVHHLLNSAKLVSIFRMKMIFHRLETKI